MKIDAYAHILPPAYFKALKEKAGPHPSIEREGANPANNDLETRFRLMDRNPEVVQVISISQPALESVVSRTDAVELSMLANDCLAELVNRYPDRFLAGVACLPVQDMEATLKETERAIEKLKLRGIELYCNIDEEELGSPRLRPLYEMMSQYDLPIWLHPAVRAKGDEPILGWPYETSQAMLSLVNHGVLRDFPNLKFIVHHAGAMTPFFEQRIRWLFPLRYGLKEVKNPVEDFRKFYCDTAIYGSTPALMCAYEFYGPEHILFGTDAPLGPDFGLTGVTIESIQRMNISEADRQKIYWQNAVDLLKIAI
jgi:predicted TIM-barrel fold metal-dependent hydrolase